MSARDRIIILVVVAVAAVAGAWMLLIQPKRKEATSLSAQVQTLQGQLDSARGIISTGLAARQEFSNDYTQLARLGEALPTDDNVPSLIYQIQSVAAASKVDFRSLQLVPGSGSSPSSSTSGSSSSSSSSASGTSGASSSASTLPPGAALGPAGLPTEQFTFSFTGDFFHLATFFHRLDQFVVAGQKTIDVRGRLMSINGISFAPGPKGFPQIAATVSATTYMAPAGTGLLDGASASGPASSSSGGSSTPSASPAPATITPSLR